MNKILFVALVLIVLPNRVEAQSSAVYDITFNSIWNANDHTSVPGTAHWSRLVGATHKSENTFLELGKLATTGIKDVAERGSNSEFEGEVNQSISLGEADQYIFGPNLGSAAGDINISGLEVKKDFPLLTLVSMIAPSPDWIVALNSFSLLDGSGNWKISETVDVYAYDAGTDSGLDYTSTDSVTNPAEPISMIAGAPINGNKMGTVTITLNSPSKLNNSLLDSQVKLHPNPVKDGLLNLVQSDNVIISEIRIFNLLGSITMVSDQLSNSGMSTIDVQKLPPGCYFVNISIKDFGILTKQLVIQ